MRFTSFIRRVVWALVVGLGVALPALKATACTIFRITLNGRTYMGNNEAWNDPATKVWFLPAEERGGTKVHGRVIFGYRNGYAQGGMNDQGLCYDWVAGYTDTQWAADPAKQDYAGNFGEKVLEEAGTVDEAIALYERYNVADLSMARTLLVDATGASAVIGFREGVFFVERSSGPCQTLGWEEQATQKRLEAMVAQATSDAKAQDILAMAGALSACRQSGAYTTYYSNIYDPSAGEVWVYQYGDDAQPVAFNLKEELAKGAHYYDLPAVRAQMTEAIRIDGKTRAAKAFDPSEALVIAGTYRAGVEVGGFDLIVTASEGGAQVLLPGEQAAREMTASGALTYFLRVADVEFTFAPPGAGDAGVSPWVSVKTWETRFDAKRVTQTAAEENTADADAAPQAPTALTAADLDRLTGAVWRGTLTYTDYTSGEQVSIPSTLRITHPEANEGVEAEEGERDRGRWLWAYGYDDEPEADSAGLYVLSEDGTALVTEGQSEIVLERADLEGGGVRFVLQREGLDDERPATMQRIIEARAGELTIRKMVRFAGTAEFFQRHEYRWKR